MAVVGADMNGLGQTAELMHVKPSAIRRWATEADLLPYVQTARLQIMGHVTSVAEESWRLALARVEQHPDLIDTRDLLAIASEATNKMQLLGGGATSRTEMRDITEGLNDQEIQHAVDMARRSLRRRGARSGPKLAEDGRLAIPATTEPDPPA